jgi:hypothetical protein
MLIYVFAKRTAQYTKGANVLFLPSEKLCMTNTQDACHSPRGHDQRAGAGMSSITPGCVKKTIKRRVKPSYII